MSIDHPIDIQSYIKSKALLIEQKLNSLTPEESGPIKTLFDAARYSLLGGGKRMRPLLLMATVEMLGGNLESSLSSACALEMIHTYSMIHDDLPCMDNDDFRRGKPSLHRAFPEAHAVLAGDFLLTYAFETIAKEPLLEDQQKVKLISLLAHHSGGHGMIGGQIMDIEAENVDLEKLQLIHRYKTGALLMAALEMGGIICKATDHEISQLRSFGSAIGLAFQIVDDVLDVTSSEQKHGKAHSSDATNNKQTYASLLGIEAAKEKAHSLVKNAKVTLSSLPYSSEVLCNLADFIVYRKS
jgi:geranylgeranyl diphosphate synthase type II